MHFLKGHAGKMQHNGNQDKCLYAQREEETMRHRWNKLRRSEKSQKRETWRDMRNRYKTNMKKKEIQSRKSKPKEETQTLKLWQTSVSKFEQLDNASNWQTHTSHHTTFSWRQVQNMHHMPRTLIPQKNRLHLCGHLKPNHRQWN